MTPLILNEGQMKMLNFFFRFYPIVPIMNHISSIVDKLNYTLSIES